MPGYIPFASFEKTFNLSGKTESVTDSETYGIVLYWEPTTNETSIRDGNATTIIPASTTIADSNGNNVTLESDGNLEHVLKTTSS